MPVYTRSQRRLIAQRSAVVRDTITDLLKQNAIMGEMLHSSTNIDEKNELLQLLQINENMLIQIHNMHPSIVRWVLCNIHNLETYYNKLFQ